MEKVENAGHHLFTKALSLGSVRYPGSEDRFINRVISDIFVGLRKTGTLTISDSSGEPVSMESEKKPPLPPPKKKKKKKKNLRAKSKTLYSSCSNSVFDNKNVFLYRKA